MSIDEFRKEIEFGLENLDKIYLRILSFSTQELDEKVKISALAYECLGYYNAIEHLIIRIFKYSEIEIPSGIFSHRDTLKKFELFVKNESVVIENGIFTILESLMAFRHIATKIYGFLIDWEKLKYVIEDINTNHIKIRQLIVDVLNTITE
jgi:hypothetical protein